MTSPRTLGRQVALPMALGAVGGVLASYIGFYIFYTVASELWPNMDFGQDSWLPSGPDMLTLALISLVVLTGVTFFAVRLGRRIATPFVSVAHAARKIAEGDLSVRARPNAHISREAALLVDDFNAMAARLETASREIVTWNAQIAHELRTPLTVLQGRLQGLVDGVFEPDPALFRGLLRQVDGLSRLVEDLRVVSLVDSGRFELRPVEVDLAAEIDDLGEMIRPALEQDGFTLTMSLQPGYARIDMTRLRQAVMALVDNARRHADPCELCIELTLEDDRADISIVDRGPGLPRGFAEDAFKLFTRADGTREAGKQGSGLGLSVVKAIAKAHRGDVRYSLENRRSAFTISLPRYARSG